jgi:hypothetical protein
LHAQQSGGDEARKPGVDSVFRRAELFGEPGPSVNHRPIQSSVADEKDVEKQAGAELVHGTGNVEHGAENIDGDAPVGQPFSPGRTRRW